MDKNYLIGYLVSNLTMHTNRLNSKVTLDWFVNESKAIAKETFGIDLSNVTNEVIADLAFS